MEPGGGGIGAWGVGEGDGPNEEQTQFSTRRVLILPCIILILPCQPRRWPGFAPYLPFLQSHRKAHSIENLPVKDFVMDGARQLRELSIHALVQKAPVVPGVSKMQ